MSLNGIARIAGNGHGNLRNEVEVEAGEDAVPTRLIGADAAAGRTGELLLPPRAWAEAEAERGRDTRDGGA